MSPGEGSICVSSFLPLPPPISKLLKSRGKSLTPWGGAQGLVCNSCLTNVCGLATEGHLQKLTLGARSCMRLSTRRTRHSRSAWKHGRLAMFCLCLLLILIGNCFCSQEDPQVTMSLGGQRVTAVVEPLSLLPSKGTVVTKEDKAGLRSVWGKESRPPLSSQPTVGDTKDPGASQTKSQKTLHCSELFPLLLLPPPGSLQKPLGQELWKKRQVPSCFPTSNHSPQEEGVKTWGKQMTCG